MASALVLGEALVDLIAFDDAGQRCFRSRYGGSPFNVAVGAARLGATVEFAGPVASDSLGAELVDFASANGVGTGYARRHDRGTVLALVSHQANRASYEYFGDWGSFALLPTIDPVVVRAAAVVHAGSTVLYSDASAATTRAAFAAASGITTLDPNPRPMLILDADAYRRRLTDLLELTQVLKISDEDASILMPGRSPLAVARKMSDGGRRVVLLSTGSSGAWVVIGDDSEHVSAMPVEVVDATGAGDSFMASIISQLATANQPQSLACWSKMLSRANAAAAWTCRRAGGAEAMPTTADLDSSACTAASLTKEHQ